MPQGSPVVVHFKEVSGSEKLRTAIEERCDPATSAKENLFPLLAHFCSGATAWAFPSP